MAGIGEQLKRLADMADKLVAMAEKEVQERQGMTLREALLDAPYPTPEKDAAASAHGFRDFKDALFLISWAELDDAEMAEWQRLGLRKDSLLLILPQPDRLRRACGTPGPLPLAGVESEPT